MADEYLKNLIKLTEEISKIPADELIKNETEILEHIRAISKNLK